MTCFMVLGWRFPDAHLRPAHRLPGGQQRPAAVRPRRSYEQAAQALVRRLPRLRDRGLGAHRQGGDRQGHRRGRWREYGRERSSTTAKKTCACRRCCCVRSCAAAAVRSLLPADVERVLHWSNYSAKAIAQIQARGMPIDMPLWNLVQENKAAVIGELLRRFDPSHGGDDPIYTPDGEWSYARFERWLVRTGVYGWPRLESGQLDIDGDAFRADVSRARHRGAARATRQPRRHRQARSCRSAATAAIAHRCFRSAPRPAATRTPRACTTRTPACARSWSFRPTRSASTSTGARRRSALPRPCPATRR